MSEKQPVEDGQELAQSLVGRTIVRVSWHDASPDEEWTGHEEAWLWLDDGRVIEFGGYGYDAWGATISEIEVTDVAQCLHCGQAHKDLQVFGPFSHRSGRQSQERYAYCVDGNNIAAFLGRGDSEEAPK